ncbi:MAG: DUF4961 domain-containing protein [Candidatus Pseudobacter hemicellulosilyticus]|uniref:DUF4961 domain-containing protein n=1 Tax=Candidatus Pseudobacter hemicellulosilyticus TaxID=3121375 RepID=A0AAJ5WNZ4_9BACT|nr:MAG: DUF4961 domain-containing protein [Pseudobacter sp.]
MKRLPKIKRLHIFLLMLVITLVVAACIEIRGLEQPSSVKAGDTLTVVVKAWMDPYYDHPQSRLIIGFLCPTSWNARNNMRMYYTSNNGNGTMSPVAANATPRGSSEVWAEAIQQRIGIGGNYINDLEWIVFQSDKAYDMSDLPEINANVTIKVKVGPENLRVKLGYFSASSMMELSEPKFYGKWFSDCFEVTDGEGELIDFCSPQISNVQPSSATDNDIITFKFDEDAITTGLSGAQAVYLCAKAYTTNNEVIEVCSQAAASSLTSIGGQKWQLDIWPRQYFNLQDNQQLERLEFYYTDATGTIKVLKQGDTGDPFSFRFGCR